MSIRLRLPRFLAFRISVRPQCVHRLDGKRIRAALSGNDALAPNTRRAYAGALERLGDWMRRRGCRLEGATLARYIDGLNERGLAAGSAQMAINAVRRYCRFHGLRRPDGPLAAAALERFRREAAGRGRGPAEPLLAEDVNAILATVDEPRRHADGRRESAERARRRARVDKAIVAVLHHGALRRSEAAMLTWGDVTGASDGHGVLIRVVRSKTNPHGGAPDVRYVNGELAEALLRLKRDDGGERHPDRPVFGGLDGASLSRRLGQAAEAAGIRKRITAHSGRRGLATELTRRGASTHDVMHAGNWKSVAMVARYSAAARAENGAVARYMTPDARQATSHERCARGGYGGSAVILSIFSALSR